MKIALVALKRPYFETPACPGFPYRYFLFLLLCYPFGYDYYMYLGYEVDDPECFEKIEQLPLFIS